MSKPLNGTSVQNKSPRARAMVGLRDLMTTGVLRPGDALPAERDLCHQLGVSLTTLHRATKALEVEGLIRSAGGRTRLVADRPSGQMKLLQDTIVVLAPSRRPPPSHHMSGWMEYVTVGAFDAIEAAGFHALAFHSDRSAPEDLQGLIDARPLGAIIPEVVGRNTPVIELVERFKTAGIGVTVFDDSPEFANVDRVVSDQVEGTAQLTAWMIAQGRRRILQILPGGRHDYWLDMRRQGYERSMREAGLEPLPAVMQLPFDSSEPEDPEVRKTLLRAKIAYDTGCLMPYLTGDDTVDAILLPSDGHAATVAGALRNFGKQPNRDVLLGGYDNFWSDCWEQKYVPICPAATIDRQNPAMGQELVTLLLDRLQGRLPAKPQRRAVSPKLVIADPAELQLT